MTNTLFIFTFSPVQPFIAEARRAADLFTGSQILVRLAQAVAGVFEKGELVYPAEITDKDVPNKLVAILKDKDGKFVAEKAVTAFFEEWEKISNSAKDEFLKTANSPFAETIWQRQTAKEYLWETYWSAVTLDDRSYAKAYKLAESALIATKRPRTFLQVEEPGFKDSLSGKRQALRSTELDGKKYWNALGKIEEITPIKIRPDGRERLDAIGVIKRFHPKLSEKGIHPFSGFPSTSSIASLDYLKNNVSVFSDYVKELEKLFGGKGSKKESLMCVRPGEPFPYDGDFLYVETLTKKRLQNDYGLMLVTETAAVQYRNLLSNTQKRENSETKKKVGRPSPYYAIIVLDGDDMGKNIKACLDEKKPEEAHKNFSRDLLQFANQVDVIAKDHQACVIYNGGDDVLAMAPLAEAYGFASALATKFKEIVKGSASAGIAITHHHSPLSAALRAARAAEAQAKAMEGKNAVCIKVLRRSGEGLELKSHWNEAEQTFPELIELFQDETLAGKLPYDVAASAYALDVADDKSQAELKRLIKRHSQDKKFKSEQAEAWAQKLNHWAGTLPNQTSELADWLQFARFIAQGGKQ